MGDYSPGPLNLTDGLLVRENAESCNMENKEKDQKRDPGPFGDGT